MAEEDRRRQFAFLNRLSIALSVGNIIAVHGGPPDVNLISEINEIKYGDENWIRIL